MKYQIKHALVQYAADVILEDVNFEVHENEKIAIVGRNGCGKTTLLKLIAGDVKMSNLDSDEECGIFMAGKPEIGFLRQISFEDGDVTVEEEIEKAFSAVFECEARMAEIEELLQKDEGGKHRAEEPLQKDEGGKHRMEEPLQNDEGGKLLSEYDFLQKKMEALHGYSWRTDMEIVFQKFGFELEDLKRPIGSFSGGQQTKVAFIKLLLERPDIMLLDEPTNHLDLTTIEWLEDYLKTYDKAVIIVSHDRMFLDKVIDVTYEIEYKKIKRYPGNYSAFLKQKEENLIKQQKDYELQQKEIQRLTEWIEKWKNTPTKVAATRSKRMYIEHMVKVEKPLRFDTKTFHALFAPNRESYTDVITTNKLKIGYDKVLSEVTFSLHKRERIAILGENGIGKSTLLKTLVGIIPALGGSFTIGTNVDYGYFDQQEAVINNSDPEQTILDNFWELYPSLLRNDVRSALGAFMFSGDEVEKKMGQLSGGELVRLALCKMFYTKPNLLILDEPTNHMDMIGKEALEQMLTDYNGTVLFVSHDRYFIKQIATGVLEFTNEEVRMYDGGYDLYLEEKRKRQAGIIGDIVKDSSNKKSMDNKPQSKVPTLDDVFDKRTYYNPGKIVSRLEKQLEKYEMTLAESEERVNELNLQLVNPDYADDYVKLMELQTQIDEAEHTIDTVLERMLETELELEEAREKMQTISPQS